MARGCDTLERGNALQGWLAVDAPRALDAIPGDLDLVSGGGAVELDGLDPPRRDRPGRPVPADGVRAKGRSHRGHIAERIGLGVAVLDEQRPVGEDHEPRLRALDRELDRRDGVPLTLPVEAVNPDLAPVRAGVVRQGHRLPVRGAQALLDLLDGHGLGRRALRAPARLAHLLVAEALDLAL